MFREMARKEIFKQAQSYAFDYAGNEAVQDIENAWGGIVRNVLEKR